MRFTISESIPRAALITGGGQHPGIAGALAEAGFAIALQCHPGDAPEIPPGGILLPADLTDETQSTALVGRAAAALGTIGVLVNAAGMRGGTTGDDTAWDPRIATNLRAPFLLIRQFAAMLPPEREGVAINLLDRRACPRRVSYSLSQAAVWTMTQTMALRLAPAVRVNGIVAMPEANPDAIGRAALAILALGSMTGQMLVPSGVPPSAP